MDVRIGISESSVVVELDLADDTDRDALKSMISDAISDGSMVWLTDKKGKETGIPGSKIAFADLGSADDARRIGFGA
jgi:hypothetical protein